MNYCYYVKCISFINMKNCNEVFIIIIIIIIIIINIKIIIN